MPTPTLGAASELLFQELLDAERRILNLIPMVAVDGSTSGAARHEVREIFSELRKPRTPAPVMEGAQREAVAPSTIKSLYVGSVPIDWSGDDVRADELDDLWLSAQEAYEKACPSYLHGHSEWTARMQAALRVLAQHPAPPPPDRVQPERVEADVEGGSLLQRMAGFIRATLSPSYEGRARAQSLLAEFDLSPPTDASGGVTSAAKQIRLIAQNVISGHTFPINNALRLIIEYANEIEAADRARKPVDASAQADAPMDVEPEYYASLPIIEAKDETSMDELVKHMVNRFLGWQLPKPWRPDNGISYTRPNYAHPPADHDWPVGTNLFTATEAEAMVRYMLEGAPSAQAASAGEPVAWQYRVPDERSSEWTLCSLEMAERLRSARGYEVRTLVVAPTPVAAYREVTLEDAAALRDTFLRKRVWPADNLAMNSAMLDCLRSIGAGIRTDGQQAQPE